MFFVPDFIVLNNVIALAECAFCARIVVFVEAGQHAQVCRPFRPPRIWGVTWACARGLAPTR